MKLLLAMLLATFAWAQTPEIHGVVIEPGIEHGVPDADITIYEAKGPLLQRQAGKVTTDSQGKFHFQPERLGDYQVIVTKEGYSGGAPRVNLTLDSEHPSREARFQLVRQGEITGRVVDDETGEPMANYPIEAVGFSYKNGFARTAGSGTLANTDKDGRFSVPDLDPGRYVMIARPRARGLSRPADAELEAHDYERSYWPGGRGLESVAPITLISGGSADAGVMRLRKAPTYRVRIAISDTNCPADDRVKISVFTLSNQFTGTYGSGEGSCGEELMLWNFQPGSYGLVLTHGEGPDRSTASLRVEVVNKDLDIAASLTAAADIEGRLIAADGTGKIPFEQLKVMAVDIGMTGTQWGISQSVGSDGRFQLPRWSPFEKALMWVMVPDEIAAFASEVRFNGVVVTGNPITLDGISATQSLEIVVDDQPATVTGTVMDGDRRASKAYVLLTRWPMPADFAYARPQGTNGDDDGQFRFAGLAPGEYRAVAVSQANRDILNEPGVLERVLRGAETIKLTRAGVQSVTLKLTDPRR